MQLIDCFQSDFIEWLVKSNNKKIGPFEQYFYIVNETYKNYRCSFTQKTLIEEYKKNWLDSLIKEALDDILQILLIEPEADYFWYTYPQNGGELTYTLPHHDVVPGDAIRINKDKLKIFLRDYKLEKLLCQTKDLN